MDKPYHRNFKKSRKKCLTFPSGSDILFYMQARQTKKLDYNLEGETALRRPCLAGEDVEAGLLSPPLKNSYINIGSRGGRKPENQKGGIFFMMPHLLRMARKPWISCHSGGRLPMHPGPRGSGWGTGRNHKGAL
jgi:hypothetical protein